MEVWDTKIKITQLTHFFIKVGWKNCSISIENWFFTLLFICCILMYMIHCCSFLVGQTLGGQLGAHSILLVMTMMLQLMSMVGTSDSSWRCVFIVSPNRLGSIWFSRIFLLISVVCESYQLLCQYLICIYNLIEENHLLHLGLLRQPKWGHLKDLHAAIKLCEPALVAANSSHYVKLGPKQEVCSNIFTLNLCSITLSFWNGKIH